MMKKRSSPTPAKKSPRPKPVPARRRARAAAQPQSIPASDFGPGEGKPDGAGFSIVGVGASAGGYESFVQLLANLPKDTGMAFVLVQHLDPKHESKLAELLARSTTLPLHDAENGVLVKPNNIYVMPPNVNMRIADGHLRFQPRKPTAPHMPVDVFLRSLAEDQQNRAIGVVLSGTGSDGTLGMQAIKGEGGITLAQDEKSAKFFGMPGSAINAGYVDLVLPPDAIARELSRVAHHPYVGRDWKPAPARAQVETAENEKMFREQDDELSSLFALLRARTAVDFSLYKHSTLKRRIMRRMLLHKLNSLPAYLDFLRLHPVEVDGLFNDLLINVTGFFRDPNVFQALKRRVYPKLMTNRPGDSPARIWVCGCSTGEEAYSMAISLVEFFETSRAATNVQIFATDISEASLERARSGLYPENISLDVSAERLRRFFVRSNGGYQVSKAIRDMCVFARQNVIVDPPFSNLDLVSCRNVLIYLGQTLQKKVMPVFHYALKPEGFLLLGSSEAIGAAADLFTLRDKKNKIYSKKAAACRASLPLVYNRDAGPKLEPQRPEPPRPKPELKAPDLQQFVDRLVLTKWAPAAVVVNSQMDVLLFRGRTGAYLEHASGSASLNLLKMARENLALDLRTAITKAIKQNAPVRQDNVPIRHDHQLWLAGIEAIPFQLPGTNERFYLVVFLEGQPTAELPGPGRPGPAAAKARQEAERREVTRLRGELASSKESLQAIIEELEATNEELKSANEEIQSSNEELQSTNEELQTRNGELSQVNNDLTNLLASINIAIVMLSNDLTVRRFTPMAERIFNLIPSDVGRRLSDLNRNIVVHDLDGAIRHVVDSLATVEQEVQDREGRWYSLRIRPYRTRENQIDGAVMLLVDIDEHKRMVELLMEAVKQPLLALHADLRVKNANSAFYRTFQVGGGETEGHFIYDLGHGQWNIPRLRTLLEEILTKQQQVDDFEVEADFPGIGRRRMTLDARSYSEERGHRRLIMLSIKDVTAPQEA